MAIQLDRYVPPSSMTHRAGALRTIEHSGCGSARLTGVGISYESIGEPRILVDCSKDGVGIVANRDGLLSLAKLFSEMAEREWDHIHLWPTMQLPASSEALVVAVKPSRELPAIAE